MHSKVPGRFDILPGMSQIRTPPSLKWYIDKRARLLGEIIKLENSLPKRLEEAKSEVVHAEVRLNIAKEYLTQLESGHQRIIDALREDIQALDRSFALHEIQIDPKIIPPIRSQNANRLLPHGSMTSSIFEALKLGGGRPMNTLEITDHVISSNGLMLSGNEYQALRESINHRLRDLYNAGKVKRLHSVKGAAIGVWALPNDIAVSMPAWAENTLRPHKRRD